MGTYEGVSNVETLTQEDGIDAIKDSVGKPVTWNESGFSFGGEIKTVVVDVDKNTELPRYIKIDVRLTDTGSDKETITQVGTDMENFGVFRDLETNELSVKFHPYTSIRDFVIEQN